jgi:hypothetical protein
VRNVSELAVLFLWYRCVFTILNFFVSAILHSGEDIYVCEVLFLWRYKMVSLSVSTPGKLKGLFDRGGNQTGDHWFVTVNLFHHTNTSAHTLLSSCLWRNHACIYIPKLAFLNWSDEFALNSSVLLLYLNNFIKFPDGTSIQVCSLHYFKKLSAGNGICKLSIKSNSIIYPNIMHLLHILPESTDTILSLAQHPEDQAKEKQTFCETNCSRIPNRKLELMLLTRL